jgi:hypothetical protein
MELPAERREPGPQLMQKSSSKADVSKSINHRRDLPAKGERDRRKGGSGSD